MLRVLSWNLYHGRAVPPAGRELLGEFTRALAECEWDVALLQEVPPWWAPELSRATGAEHRLVLTSRNGLLALRRAIATRWPDVIKSNGGGGNAILVRGGVIVEERTRRLCLLPERRWLQAVRRGDGTWFANLHATAHNSAAARRDAQTAAQTALAWAGGDPIVLGGDFNLRELELPGFVHAAGHDVDHVFAAGLGVGAEAAVLEHGRLSDHAPVLATLAS